MSAPSDGFSWLELDPPVLDSARLVDASSDVGQMYLHRDDEVITPTIVKTGCWEPEEAAFLRTVLRSGANFLDVGANVGYFTLLASSIVGPNGRVVAIEPESRNVELLRANAWRNKAWNVQIIPVAADAETGYVGLRLSAVNRGDHQVVAASTHSGSLVPAARLDELIAGTPVDVIKIDVQGLDHQVVEGLVDVLGENPGVVVMCEFWLTGMEQRGIDPRAVIARYEQLGLRIGLLGAAGSVTHTTAADVIEACRTRENDFVNLVLSSPDSEMVPVGPQAADQQPTASPDAGRWEPIFYEGWERVIPDRALWVGPNDPVAHFLRWPFEYRAYLTLLCGLKRNDTVLELGCNHGRTMLALLDYLRPPGRYEGLDILEPHIAYARDHIEALAPHFRFTLADIYNDAYNPTGTQDASDYQFPYEGNSFNCAYAASLFTHLLPPATANYLRETRRVLKPGGSCLYSFFILDFYGGPGTSAHSLYEFDGRLEGVEGVGVRDVNTPGAVIAYTRGRVEEMAADAGLSVNKILPGYWSAQGDYAVNEQDLVVLEAT
jgi:FkbM family methyltransferase